MIFTATGSQLADPLFAQNGIAMALDGLASSRAPCWLIVEVRMTGGTHS